jgi:hypothetical protein
VVDEALTGFLDVYNPAVRALRAKLPFLLLPTFTFRVWLGGLVAAVALLFTLSPAACADAAWMHPVAVIVGVVMAGNGLLHMGASAYRRQLLPGTYSAPLLLAAALYLLRAVL